MPDELEPYRQRLRALVEPEGEGFDLSIWKEAVRDLPDSVAARERLYELYRWYRLPEQAARLAVESCSRGMDVFAEPLLANHAAIAPPELLERLVSIRKLRPVLTLAHLERREPEKAADVVMLSLREAKERLADTEFYPDVMLQVIARTASAGLTERAHSLVEGFAEGAVSPNSVRLLPGPLGERWSILREADRLREKLPRPVFESIAEATLPDHLAASVRQLLVWSGAHRLEAFRVRRRLKAESPELYRAFGGRFAQLARRPLFGRWTWRTWFAFFAVLNLLRVGLQMFGTTAKPSASAPGHRASTRSP